MSLGKCFPPHPLALPQRMAQCKISVETVLHARALWSCHIRAEHFEEVRSRSGRRVVVLTQSSSGAPRPTSWRNFAPHKLTLYWQNQRVALCSLRVNGNFRGFPLLRANTRLQSRSTKRKPCACHRQCVHPCSLKLCCTFNPDAVSYTAPASIVNTHSECE